MAIALHWIVAAFILALLVVGYYFNTLPDGHESRGLVISWHKSIGLTAVVLVILRLIWRLTHRPPALPKKLPGWQRTAARANAVFLYLLMFLQPLLGYLSTSYSGYSTRWFGLALPKWAEKSPELNQLFSDAHHLGAKLLVLALLLHVGGAAMHGIVRRDGVLSRMLP
ncbi:MAG: cytochrome b [Pseudomonadota bacterium]